MKHQFAGHFLTEHALARLFEEGCRQPSSRQFSSSDVKYIPAGQLSMSLVETK